MFQSLNRAYKRSDDVCPLGDTAHARFQSLNRAYKRSDAVVGIVLFMLFGQFQSLNRAYKRSDAVRLF